MRLIEIESEAVRADVAAALEQAGVDVTSCEGALAAANQALGGAETERERCARLLGSLQQQLAAGAAQMAKLKRRALESAANQTPDRTAYDDYVKARARRAWLADVLAYTGSWPVEDAERVHLAAQIAERNATADLLEAQAARARLNLLAAASSAMQCDPGAMIQVSESWSQKAAEEAMRIRRDVVPELERKLGAHERRVAKERELVGANLFN